MVVSYLTDLLFRSLRGPRLSIVTQSQRKYLRSRRIRTFVVGALFLGSLVFLTPDLSLGATVEFLLSSFDPDSVLSAVAFTAAYVLAALVFVPAALLTLIAGGLYGFKNGVLIVAMATTLADAVAFLLARHVFRARVERLAQRYPQFQAVDQALTHGSWRLVALLRLNPTIPYSVCNYFFGITGIRFLPYLIASGIFTLPGAVIYVYLGKNGVETLQGRIPTWPEWALFVAGIAAIFVAIPYVFILVWNSFRKANPKGLISS